MYFLTEQSPNGLSIIGEFNCIKDAENKMIEMENLDADNGYWCTYFVTKIVRITNELDLIKLTLDR